MITCSFLFISSGCKKNETEKLKLEGTITDSSTGQTLSGVSVLLEGQLLQSGTFNTNFQDIASASTNSSGEFEMEIDRDNYNELRLIYVKSSYLDFTEIISADELSPSGTDYSVALDPVSTVNLRLVNSSPSSDDDEIEFRYTSAFFPQCSCCTNTPRVFIGTDIDTTLTCTIVGNTQLDYAYFVTKNGFESVFTNGVFVNSFETADIVINY
ncbi:MAG: hypothetical protein AB8B53_11380 [Flavobacteriales bacterium]